jgi:hypothetical protein
VLFATGERRFDVGNQSVLEGVLAEHVGAAEIGLPLLKEGPEIQVDDIIVRQPAVRRLRVIGEHCVGSSADDALVPMPAHTELASGELVNLRAELTLEHACPDEPGVHYGRE